MPTLLNSDGFRFFFYSQEGRPLEPPHVHVRQGNREAKLWLTPIIRVAWSRRIDPRTLKRLTDITEAYRAESRRNGMYSLPEPIAVRFADEAMSVDLDDGRTITVPVAWYPRLSRAGEAERLAFELSAGGIHWPGIDEDVSVEGMLAGRGDVSRAPLKAA